MKTKENKAITLIALVVTIILLLILAGTSISMLTGQNGILNRAEEAKEKMANTNKEEKADLQNYEKITNQYTSKLPTENYTVPYLPDSNKFEMIGETNLETGLVIREKETGSEYVWVEVPQKEDVYKIAGLTITDFNDDEYDKIEKDLHLYTQEYRNNTDFEDTYYQDNTAGWITENEYKDAKRKMLKSIYLNGGFWVGRYEAGFEDKKYIRDSSTEPQAIPVTKKNAYPYNYVNRTQAEKLSESIEAGQYSSSLMFGVQWDLMLKFIENKKGNTIQNIKEILKSKSNSIGNYANSSFDIINNDAKYSVDRGKIFYSCPYQKNSNERILLTTGSNEDFSLMNIYDFSGNVWEWTLEYSFNQDNPCVNRGGSCYNEGNYFFSAFRNYYSISYADYYFGFRVTIY